MSPTSYLTAPPRVMSLSLNSKCNIQQREKDVKRVYFFHYTSCPCPLSPIPYPVFILINHGAKSNYSFSVQALLIGLSGDRVVGLGVSLAD
ncbi:MAG: hypothetical protein AB1847_20555 [bacterium]